MPASEHLQAYKVFKLPINEEITQHHLDHAKISSYPKKLKTNKPGFVVHYKPRSTSGDNELAITHNGKIIALATFQPAHFDFGGYIPHASVDKNYRGSGLMKSLYVWALEAGEPLVTQYHSADAQKLWDSLSRHYHSSWYSPSTRKFINKPTASSYRVLSKKPLP
jgi:hypothetical protein